MSVTPSYTYTPEQVTAAFNEIKATLFRGITAEQTPKILVVAGLQGAGKTFLLEKHLLPSKRYDKYVRLYLPEYRRKHPQYAEMIKLGVLHAYEHTQAFVEEVSEKIFTEAFTLKYNIIMECAFDRITFATFPPLATAAGYQFETHIVGCTREFAHVSSIKRALKSLENQELERFVSYAVLDASMSLAHAIILACEVASKAVDGSQITLYERGPGSLKERVQRAHFTYPKADTPAPTPSTAPTPNSTYANIINNHVCTPRERDEMVKDCHLALLKAQTYDQLVPAVVYNDLYSYIVKYVYR
ncbi:Zeta toxin [Pseudomonas arsenicoxydans]|uniref:Zeta toxin n=1 Tax=Pseudomonas arsenicoxydans TaxID=702115 RepID=A0A1H0PA11_9PSED|nr:zeta toxin family protein [Pseudomonas arsenicoxydans]SDP01528.1 Zeta toxin [Pseudomonas arsenicoxydans]